MSNLMKMLREPFPASDIEWRAGATNKDKTKAMALAYITSRAVQERLDDVFGVGGWFDNYVSAPNGGLQCELSCKVDGEWITKRGLADNTDFEAVKGGESGALKRAAVKFGIGRYLYDLGATWVTCQQYGKSVKLTSTPSLPAWALPGNTTTPKPQENAVEAVSDGLESQSTDERLEKLIEKLDTAQGDWEASEAQQGLLVGMIDGNVFNDNNAHHVLFKLVHRKASVKELTGGQVKAWLDFLNCEKDANGKYQTDKSKALHALMRYAEIKDGQAELFDDLDADSFNAQMAKGK